MLALSASSIDQGLELAGILISVTALGSGAGITAAVLERKSIKTIELWGFRGTAAGFVLGFFLASCTFAARS